jgi:hypothetical protein
VHVSFKQLPRRIEQRRAANRGVLAKGELGDVQQKWLLVMALGRFDLRRSDVNTEIEHKETLTLESGNEHQHTKEHTYRKLTRLSAKSEHQQTKTGERQRGKRGTNERGD